MNLKRIIDWEKLCDLLERAFVRSEGSKARKPPFDSVMILVLKAIHSMDGPKPSKLRWRFFVTSEVSQIQA